MSVQMRFIDAGEWDGGDDMPRPVPMPRVPVLGEIVRGPDDFGAWKVVHIEFDYINGFHFDPITRLTLEREEASR